MCAWRRYISGRRASPVKCQLNLVTARGLREQSGTSGPFPDGNGLVWISLPWMDPLLGGDSPSASELCDENELMRRRIFARVCFGARPSASTDGGLGS